MVRRRKSERLIVWSAVQYNKAADDDKAAVAAAAAAADNNKAAAADDVVAEPGGDSDFDDSMRISDAGFPRSIDRTSPVITDDVSDYGSDLVDEVSIVPALQYS
jgi:hypothetical protein